MSKIKNEFREKKVIRKVAELNARGLTPIEIAKVVNEELDLKNKVSHKIVRNIIKSCIIKHKEFLDKDADYAKIYRETLLELINEGRSNIKIVTELRQTIMNRLEAIKKEIPSAQMMIFAREISNLIRTLNDTLRTIDKNLERLESQQKEIKMSAVQNVRLTIQTLKELEDQGYIKINPEKAKYLEEMEDDR